MSLLANSSCTFDSTSNSTARLMALSSSGERAPAFTIALRASSGSSPGGAPGSISAAVALTAAVALAAAEMLAASAADRSGCCALLAPSSGSSAPCRGIKRWGVCVAGEEVIPRSAAAGGAAEASVVGGDSLRKILSDSEPYGGIERMGASRRATRAHGANVRYSCREDVTSRGMCFRKQLRSCFIYLGSRIDAIARPPARCA